MPAQPVPDSHKKPRTGRGIMKQKHDALTGSYRPQADISQTRKTPLKAGHYECSLD